MSNFFNELKNRNVYKAATAYVVSGWLIMQVVDTMSNNLSWPPVIASWITKILIVGFPIALVITWLYEMTPHGLKRTGSIQQDTPENRRSGKRLNHLIIGALAITICFMLVERVFFAGNIGINDRYEASIAVLPFKFLSNEKDSEFMAEGIPISIYDKLALVNDLLITSTTSSFKFRDQEKDTREIGEDLNVNYLLEGNISYNGNKWRVNVSLVNASNGYTRWSQSFEESSSDVYKIPESISRKVVSELKVNLLPEVSKRMASNETAQEEALKLYLMAVDTLKFRGPEDFLKARELLNQALEYDPDFILAHTALVYAYTRHIDREEGHELMSKHLKRAEELDPDHGEVYYARGWHEGYVNGDREAALASFKEAKKRMPGKAKVYMRIYFLTSGAEKYANLQKAFELNPLDPEAAQWMCNYYCQIEEDCDKGIRIMEKALEMDPDKKVGIYTLSENWGRKPYGDLVKSFKVLYNSYERNPSDPATLVWLSVECMKLGIMPLADRLFQSLQAKYPEEAISKIVQLIYNEYRGKYSENITIIDIWLQRDEIPKYDANVRTIWNLFALQKFKEVKDLVGQTTPGISNIDSLENAAKSIQTVKDLNIPIEYIISLRKVGETALADRYAKVLCRVTGEQLANDKFLKRIDKTQLTEDCLIAQNKDLELIAFLDKVYFEDKDRTNFDINSPIYMHLHELPEFQKLKTRVDEETLRMRDDVVAYLKEKGDWDPAWDKELGLE